MAFIWGPYPSNVLMGLVPTHLWWEKTNKVAGKRLPRPHIHPLYANGSQLQPGLPYCAYGGGKGRKPAAAASPKLRNKLLHRSLTPFMACWWVHFKSTMACLWFVGGMHAHLSASMTAAVYAPQGAGPRVAEISRRGRPRSLSINCLVSSRISP